MVSTELEETVRAAFTRYDHDGNGTIDSKELRHLVKDLGGIMTVRDHRSVLRVLDRNKNGAIDLEEFTRWWTSQTGDLDGDGSVGEVEKTLARLKEIGCQRFHVDIHTAAWNGLDEVVTRLIEGNAELVHDRDVSEYGVRKLQRSMCPLRLQHAVV